MNRILSHDTGPKVPCRLIDLLHAINAVSKRVSLASAFAALRSADRMSLLFFHK